METIPGTLIPKTPDNLFVNKPIKDSIFDVRRCQTKLSKILDSKKDQDGKPLLDERGKEIPWIEYPEEGGYLTYHKTFPYPEKGIRDDFVMSSCALSKRAFINWIHVMTCKSLIPMFLVFFFYPWKLKIKTIEFWMSKVLELSEFITAHHPYILEKKYFTPLGRELIKGVYAFLVELGINPIIADKFTMMFVSFIDLDTAYRYRVNDIFSETTNELMLTGSKEINRILSIFAQREARPHLVSKFNKFAKPIALTLWHPRIKRAYQKAINAMDFSKMGLDEADRYHVRNLSGYNFFGMTIKERNEKWPPEEHLYMEMNL